MKFLDFPESGALVEEVLHQNRAILRQNVLGGKGL